MTIYGEVDALQIKVAALKNSLEACQREIAQQGRARQAEAPADRGPAPQAAPDLAQAEPADHATVERKSFKADMTAKVQELERCIDQKHTKHKANDAEHSAEWKEGYAMDALDFAGWAIDQAEAALLEAADARALAIARGAAPAPHRSTPAR